MKKSIVGAVILAICAVSLFKVENYPLALLFVALAVLVLVLAFRKKAAGKSATPPKPAPVAPASPVPYSATPRPAPDNAKPQYSFVNFNVAGVTFNNDDGSSRQYILRKIKFGDPPFEDQDNLTISVRPTEFEGERAYAIEVNGHRIGNAPRAVIPQLDEALNRPDAMVSGFRIVGGGEGYSYGAEMAVRYTP